MKGVCITEVRANLAQHGINAETTDYVVTELTKRRFGLSSYGPSVAQKWAKELTKCITTDGNLVAPEDLLELELMFEAYLMAQPLEEAQ